jgi:hypothetical protein
MRIIFCKFIQRSNCTILCVPLAVGRAIYILSLYVEVFSVLKMRSKSGVCVWVLHYISLYAHVSWVGGGGEGMWVISVVCSRDVTHSAFYLEMFEERDFSTCQEYCDGIILHLVLPVGTTLVQLPTRSLSYAVLPTSKCIANLGALTWVCILVAMIFWALHAMKAIYTTCSSFGILNDVSTHVWRTWRSYRVATCNC